jgi:hypothetical protein
VPSCALDKRTELGCCDGGCPGTRRHHNGTTSVARKRPYHRRKRPRRTKRTMFHRVLSVAAALCTAASILASAAFAQNNDAKPADQTPSANGQEQAQKIDEFAEAQKAIDGPAGNPECVWLGRRVVSLLWRDDLDTAFRHLDLYDRFGCPAAHIQASFRCLLLHSASIDPKAPDSLNSRVQACWINPALPPATPPAAATPAPAAAAPSPTTTR